MNEIIPGLWIGNMDEARYLERRAPFENFAVICVLESWQGHWLNVWQPLLSSAPNGQVAKWALDAVAGLIQAYLDAGRKVFVHCGAGIERSPLAVAWYLIKSKHAKDFDEAYKIIREKRPEVMDRRFWIEGGV